MDGSSLARAIHVPTGPLHTWQENLVEPTTKAQNKQKEVLHLCRWSTHTHPVEAGSTLKGKRKKKANTDDGQKARTAQGGEGNKRTSKTNLHGETDLTKTAHTPKPHDTLRRGTRGELGTKWGTSWWQTRKPKQLIKQQDSVPSYLKVVRYSLSGTVVKSCPNWHKWLSSSSELGAQHVSPHQIPKRPHLQEKDMPVAFICSCHVSCQKLKLQVRKLKFLTVRSSFTWKSADHWDPWDIRSCRKSQNGWKP